jgi:hypothetical protein
MGTTGTGSTTRYLCHCNTLSHADREKHGPANGTEQAAGLARITGVQPIYNDVPSQLRRRPPPVLQALQVQI